MEPRHRGTNGDMAKPAQPVMNVRAEQRAILGLFAVFALLVQALIPSLAMSYSPSAAGLEICTITGAQAAPAETPGPNHPASGHCQHCICPLTLTATLPVLVTLQVTYTFVRAALVETPRALWPMARAPPRPPGQGPPALNV